MDMKLNLKHHTIHCISAGASFKTLTGFTLSEFATIFRDVLDDMKIVWPRCPVSAEENAPQKPYGTLRFKLFLAFYRLRRYLSYQAMEVP